MILVAKIKSSPLTKMHMLLSTLLGRIKGGLERLSLMLNVAKKEI
jgi:hypothetical protein